MHASFVEYQLGDEAFSGRKRNCETAVMYLRSVAESANWGHVLREAFDRFLAKDLEVRTGRGRGSGCGSGSATGMRLSGLGDVRGVGRGSGSGSGSARVSGRLG